MSASDKKKLRKEQAAAQMTAKQKQEKAEAKKLKAYTIGFVSLLAVIIIAAASFGIFNWYKQSGIAERKTVAATIGGYDLSTVELSYYYQDSIHELYNSVYSSSYGEAYAEMYFETIGLDLTQPLAGQIDKQTGKPWTESILQGALESAQVDVALYHLADQAGFSLSTEDRATLDQEIALIRGEADGDPDAYLENIYGYGATLKTYVKYRERKMVAEAYYNYYYESLTFEDDQLREYEKEKSDNYNSYTYSYAQLSYRDFLEGGTKDENGTTIYTDEQNDAARQKLQEAADALVLATDAEDLKAKIKDIQVNETSALAVNKETDLLHTSVSTRSADLAKWLADSSRKEGEVGLVKITQNTTVTDGENTSEKEIINGYFVVIFHSKNDNTGKMDNVRHLLITPNGGVYDEATGSTVYTAEEQATARTEAQALLDHWKNNPTKENFIALVEAHTDDGGSKETGGLYEDIHQDSNYVDSFRNWAIDPARKEGDTAVVESEYGQHIMYYEGESERSYRDYLITEDLRNDTITEWYDNAIAKNPIVQKDLSMLNMEFIVVSGK